MSVGFGQYWTTSFIYFEITLRIAIIVGIVFFTLPYAFYVLRYFSGFLCLPLLLSAIKG